MDKDTTQKSENYYLEGTQYNTKIRADETNQKLQFTILETLYETNELEK